MIQAARTMFAGLRAYFGHAGHMIRDRAGLASVEFSIVMGAVGVAVITGGNVLAPALHEYLLRIERAVAAATAALAQLPASCGP